MDLDEVKRRGIPYAICTDVGASPTTSILCEMAEFLAVHAHRSSAATGEEALYRATLAPAQILGLDGEMGSFEVGKGLSFVEIEPAGEIVEASAEEVIRNHLLELPMAGWPAYEDLLIGLGKKGLSSPRDMDTLAGEFGRTVDRLRNKVRRVVMNGEEVYRRETAA
jgi:hypothetical protein